MDKDPRDILLDAMEGLQAFAQRMEANREKRLWKKVDIPCTLTEAVNRLSKKEMDQIRKNLDLGGLSALKKADLAAELVKKIPTNFKYVITRLEQRTYSQVKKIAQNDGVIEDKGISVSDAETFLGYSLIFPGIYNNQKVLFMPSELVQIFLQFDSTELDERIKRNTEWVLLTQGMLYYYGVMAEVPIIERIKELTGKDVDIVKYLHVMSSAIDFNGQVEYSSYGLRDHRVRDDKRIAKEHRKKPGVDYYPFTKKQLRKAGVPGYVDYTPAMSGFISYLLERYELNNEETDEIATQLINIINADGKQNDILDYLHKWLEIPSFEFAQLLTKEITKLYNNTRQWALKGHTPAELFQEEKEHLKPLPSNPVIFGQAASNVIDLKTRTKTGRNDPCPCGSGKKYKKCCGR